MTKRPRPLARRRLALPLLVVGGSLLAACGGGGGGGGGPQTLTITGTKAREGVAGGGGATVGNTLLLGDTSGNVARSAFLSFSLAGLPSGGQIVSATLAVEHLGVTSGAPYATLGVLTVDRVALGAGLDPGDATASALSPAIGTLSDDASAGVRVLDVTAAVLADLQASATRTEFRLRFTVGTDGDGQQDTIQVAETDNLTGDLPPTLTIVYVP